MGDIYTSGSWKPNPGSEDVFVEAWTEFATWATGVEGAGTLRLLRDLKEPDRYVSFGDWESEGAARAWKDLPEFRERLAHVLQHVAEFHSTNLTVVASAEAGASARAALA